MDRKFMYKIVIWICCNLIECEQYKLTYSSKKQKLSNKMAKDEKIKQIEPLIIIQIKTKEH